MIKRKSNYTLNHEEEIKEKEKRKKEIDVLNEKVLIWNAKADKIREQFDFFIPNYLIDEIIEKEETNLSFSHCSKELRMRAHFHVPSTWPPLC